MAGAYGAEHLLRLLVKLPEIFASAQLTPKAWLDVKARLLDFVAFLKSNTARFFSAAYDPVHKVYLDAVDKEA
jgi:mortality factor 4-like protein 1